MARNTDPIQDEVTSTLFRTQKRLDAAQRLFTTSTIVFFALFLLGIATSISWIGYIAIALVFCIWFPSMTVAAFASKKFAQHVQQQLSRHNW